jgi:hypothetical protein
MMTTNDNKQMVEEKIGEALGLEMAAQKAVEELGSKGLLDKGGMKDKLEKMRKQANNHQRELEELRLSTSLELDSIGCGECELSSILNKNKVYSFDHHNILAEEKIKPCDMKDTSQYLKVWKTLPILPRYLRLYSRSNGGDCLASSISSAVYILPMP